MANKKKKVDEYGQPIEELLGIAGERTAVQFQYMLFSAFGEDDLHSPVRITIEYHPRHRPGGDFGPVIWYRIDSCGEEFTETLSGPSLRDAEAAFS